MAFYGIYIPEKAHFKGSVEQFPGSLAAVNYNSTTRNGDLKDNDAEYPHDSPLWLVFSEKSKALSVLPQYKEARLREFPNLEQAVCFVQFGFESLKSMKLCGKSRRIQTSFASSSATSAQKETDGGNVSSITGGTGDSPNVNQITEPITCVSAQLETRSERSTFRKLNSNVSIKTFNEMDINSESAGDSGNSYAIVGDSMTVGATETSQVVDLPHNRPNNVKLVSERPIFRGPTKQELTEFRKAIETGDFARVKRIIWDNPRYLISSGDTPTNLKEGYRYNAIHICALYNQAKIAELILQTVSDYKFTNLYTGRLADSKICNNMSATLLDYYLNIPDKARSETPLHFAAKNGYVEVIKVLTSYPQCKSKPNKEGQLPKDIICYRVSNPTAEICRKIKLLLTERFYVAVQRDPDNVVPPQVSHPFSSNNPPAQNISTDSGSPVIPGLKIMALAGPMDKEQAQKFYRRWKTPPRIRSQTTSPVANKTYILPMKSSLTPRSIFTVLINGRSGLSSCVNENEVISAADDNNLNVGDVKDDSVSDFGNDNDQLQSIKTDDTLLSGQHLLHSTPTSSKERSQIMNGFSDSESRNKVGDEGVSSDSVSSIGDAIEKNNNNTSNISGSETTTTIKTQSSTEETAMSAMQMSFLKLRLGFSNTTYMQLRQEAFSSYRDVDLGSPLLLPSSAQQISMQSSDSSPSTLNNSFKERHIKNSDFEKGFEVIGRQLAKQEKVDWMEYWDFLDTFADIAEPTGLERLENYLKERSAKNEAAGTELCDLANVCSALHQLKLSEVEAQQLAAAKTDTNTMITAIANKNSSTASDFVTAMAADAVTIPQVSTPYTCVEKSVQVFAKRLTKTIIHNINNVVSINDSLLSELKRLKSLICSFKEDTRFYSVDFTKVHSRFGSLVAIYITHSQEVTVAIKVKIQGILRDLMNTNGERREHLECLCSQMLQMLEQPGNELPHNLKNEELCANAWFMERACNCLWDVNLSRKTSRRKRLDFLNYAQQQFHHHQQYQQQQKRQQQQNQPQFPMSTDRNAGNIANGEKLNSNRNSANDPYESDDESEFFSGSSDSSDSDEDEESSKGADDEEENDDDDELYGTPPENLASTPVRYDQSETPERNAYKCFIFGDEPTKRDLDVLNAISLIEIDSAKYPYIHAWLQAMQTFSTQEMMQFASPAVVKKVKRTLHQCDSPMQFKQQTATPKFVAGNNDEAAASPTTAMPLFRRKRILASPKLFASKVALNNQFNYDEEYASTTETNADTDATTSSPPPAAAAAVTTTTTTPSSASLIGSSITAAATHVFKTPLNKMRGLFSNYREPNARSALDTPLGNGSGNESNRTPPSE